MSVNAPACTARMPITATPFSLAAAMISRGFAGPSKNFSPPGESSKLAMTCTAEGFGASASTFKIASGWPIPVTPQAPIRPSFTNFSNNGRMVS